MEYKELLGNNIEEDIEEVQKEIAANSNIVFVYSGPQTLYDYIDALYAQGDGLDEDDLYKFKVCYEKTDLEISYSSRKGKRNRKITSMSSLVNELDGKNSCRIVVENDDRVQLAFIAQQLIFLGYPLEKVDILLKKEERDADKTKRFMKNVDKLLEGCDLAIEELQALRDQVENEKDNDNPTKSDRLKDIDETLESCCSIKEQICKSKEVELKLAVAASKKAGKSVIVNCFIGDEIAPTSTELATPNNCFYRRSKDGKYHLQLGDGEIQDFDNRKDIHDKINDYFREAQNDRSSGFSLADMNIQYVSKGNNFSSYSIFDTAGPDAAVSDAEGHNKHREAALRALDKCDVAVFAIDYSKYLTETEEEYLREIKNKFESQHKFHSLIFALNKIDVRYTDVNSPKSLIMSVDFIKTRLGNIDKAYRDCIIFPTCSLEYYYAIEAEKNGVTELNAENNLPIEEMRKVKFKHRDVKALAWLHNHSENLDYYHGIKNISYDVFKKDSGMPALMSYVSYVAQSKARDEIVNAVTYKIASQKMKVQAVFDSIANIEALINADDEQIDNISKIIDDYNDAVEDILVEGLKQEEIDKLPAFSILKSRKGNYKKLLDYQKGMVDTACEKKKIAETMYSEMVNKMWSKIKERKEISGRDIDKLFTSEDFETIAKRIGTQKIKDVADLTRNTLENLRMDVKDIAEDRQKQLNEKSDECLERLKKEHINLELPKPPEFEFSAEMPSLEGYDIGRVPIDFDLSNNLSDFFEMKFFGNIGIFFGNLFGNMDDKDYKYKFSGDYKSFVDICNNELKDTFKDTVYENNIPETLADILKKSVVDGYMKDVTDEFKETFDSLNSTYQSYIERFRSAVDDRDKYKSEIGQYNLRKNTIMSIGECTKDFMDTWDNVIQDFTDDEKTDDTAELKGRE